MSSSLSTIIILVVVCVKFENGLLVTPHTIMSSHTTPHHEMSYILLRQGRAKQQQLQPKQSCSFVLLCLNQQIISYIQKSTSRKFPKTRKNNNGVIMNSAGAGYQYYQYKKTRSKYYYYSSSIYSNNTKQHRVLKILCDIYLLVVVASSAFLLKVASCWSIKIIV